MVSQPIRLILVDWFVCLSVCLSVRRLVGPSVPVGTSWLHHFNFIFAINNCITKM